MIFSKNIGHQLGAAGTWRPEKAPSHGHLHMRQILSENGGNTRKERRIPPGKINTVEVKVSAIEENMTKMMVMLANMMDMMG